MKKYNLKEIKKIIFLPLADLIFKAQSVHQENFKSSDFQLASLISIKTGSCPEDCKYCPQSAHYNVDLKKEKLIEIARGKKLQKQQKIMVLIGFAWGSLEKTS